ncbi:MAG: hypothetical protein IKR47_01390 [Lachnospiraceae bacterium]|nr:hypothetical protein [Lachnospiraceae bacterium]
MQAKSNSAKHTRTKGRSLTGTIAMILLLAFTAVLIGCGKKEEGANLDAIKDKLKENIEAQNAKNEKEPETDTGKIDEVPEEEEQASSNGVESFEQVYLKARYDSEWDENHDHKNYLNYNYEKIELGDADAKKYPELAKKLMIVNDLIVTEESNSYMSRMKEYQAKDDQEIDLEFDNFLLPYKEDWRIYKRRSDSAAFSIVTVYTDYASIDYNRVHFTGYNFDPKTGEEFKLSDVVKDEDAFIALVAKKALPLLQSELPDGVDYTEEGMIADVREYLQADIRGNWTLDPEGVSVWFDSHTMLPISMHISVLFADDPEGKIFADSYRENAPENWTLYMPFYTQESFFSADTDRINTLQITESYAELDGYEYVNGLWVYCNGVEDKVMLGDEITINNMALVHKGDQTYFFLEYSEYEYNSIETFVFKNDKVKMISAVSGSVASIPWEELEEDDYMIPNMLLSDPTNITVNCLTDSLSTCSSMRHYILEDGGELEGVEDYYTLLPDSQYEIRAKYNISGLHVVDKETHEVLSDTYDMKVGDTFKMLYTDDQTYVDGLLKDGTMVRVMIKADPEGWRYVPTDEGDIEVWQSFDDMFFAG